VRLVMASTVWSVGTGLAAGLGVSLTLSKVLARWTQESSQDPLILAGVMAVLGLAAAMACLAPAQRASAINPMEALRWE
jgi:hypothetical protein